MYANVEVMLVLMLIVLAGLLAGRLGYMDDAFCKKLSSLIVDITCPALILSSTMGEQMPDSQYILPLLLVSTITYLLLTVVAIFLPRHLTRRHELEGQIGFAIAFGNVGFIGYPIVASMFGHQAVFYAAILNVPNTLFVFVLGSMLIQGGGKLRFNWRLLISTPMLACYLAIVVVALRLDGIPHLISAPLTSIGQITVPAALLIIGANMSKLRLRDMLGGREVYVTALLRLVLVPLVMFFLFQWAGVDPLIVSINTVVIGMPIAAYGTIFCLRYSRDTKWMTEATFITTLLAIVTIPLMSLLFS